MEEKIQKDELFDEVMAFVTESGNVSLAAIQRKFSVGYARAARIVEQMEDLGIVYYEDNVRKLNKEVIDNPQYKAKEHPKRMINDKNGFDILMPEVLKYFIECGKISISKIQRKFIIGYARAASILDKMEENGFVETREDCKPRKVLITKEQFVKLFEEIK